MRDVLADVMSIWRSGGTAGVATVVRTFRLAPRLPGSMMVIAPDGMGRRLIVTPDDVAGGLGSARDNAAVTDDACGLLAAGRTELLCYGPAGQRRGEGMEVFRLQPRPAAADAGVTRANTPTRVAG